MELKWIDASKMLPPERKEVLVHNENGYRVARLERDEPSKKLEWCHMHDTCGCCDFFSADTVADWAELPKWETQKPIEKLTPEEMESEVLDGLE